MRKLPFNLSKKNIDNIVEAVFYPIKFTLSIVKNAFYSTIESCRKTIISCIINDTFKYDTLLNMTHVFISYKIY